MPDAVATVINDAKAELLKIITSATDSIKADPSTANVAAQGAVALASLIPLVPKLENDAIVQAATSIQEVAQTALAPTA